MKHSKLLALTPPLYLFISAAIFGTILHTRQQFWRLWYLPLFLTVSFCSMSASKHFWFSTALQSLWNQAVTLYMLHAVSVLYIEQWPAPRSASEKTTADSETPPDSDRWTEKFRQTYRIWGNPQMLRVACDNEKDAKAPAPRSSARQLLPFIFLRAVKLPLYYYTTFYLLPLLVSETLGDIQPQDVGATQQQLLRRLSEFTAREAVIRAHTAVFWIWESVIYLDGANAVLAIVFVLLGLDSVEDWPSLFGSPITATSLRGFWSGFWHKLALRPYKNYGRVMASRVLGLRERTVPFNAVVAFVVFALSGATHAVVVWQAGLQDWHLEIQWFLLNFLGCAAETTFLNCLRAAAKKLGWSRELRDIEDSWFRYFVGYAWVFAFFFWSVPKWKYPRMELQAIGLRRLRSIMNLFKAEMTIV